MNKIRNFGKKAANYFYSRYHPSISLMLGFLAFEIWFVWLLKRLNIIEYNLSPIEKKYFVILIILAIVLFSFYLIIPKFIDKDLKVIPTKSDHKQDFLLNLVIEELIIIFSSWHISYNLALLIKFDARLIYIPFITLVILINLLCLPHWKGRKQGQPFQWHTVIVLVIGLLIGYLFLYLGRPSCDDIQFLHRALVQINQLDSPLIVKDILFATPVPRTFQGFIPSYEFFVSLNSNLLGIFPLTGFYVITVWIAGFLLAIVYFQIYVDFGLRKPTALLALFLSILFIVLDGNGSRSFGTHSIGRLWQGKTIMWTIVIPCLMLFTYRYYNKPSFYSYMFVLLLNITAAGLSGSGLFMAPAMVASVSMAMVFSENFSSTSIKHALIILTATFYNVFLLLGMLVNFFPTYNLIDKFQSWPRTWTLNLKLVLDSAATNTRNMWILISLPLVFLPLKKARFPLLLALSTAALYTNPLTGPFIFDLVSAGAYWRLAYLFLVPISFGFMATFWDTVRDSIDRREIIKLVTQLTVLIIVIFWTAKSYQSSIFDFYAIKRPFEFPVPEEEITYSQVLRQDIQDTNVLMPDDMVCVAPLIVPDMTLESGRTLQTLYGFERIDRTQDGIRRVEAKDAISSCDPQLSDEDLYVLNETIEKVDSVVVLQCLLSEPNIAEHVDFYLENGWSIKHITEKYFLLTRRH